MLADHSSFNQPTSQISQRKIQILRSFAKGNTEKKLKNNHSWLLFWAIAKLLNLLQWTLAQRQQTVNVTTWSTAFALSLKYHMTRIVCLRYYFKNSVAGLIKAVNCQTAGTVLQISPLMKRSCTEVSCHCMVNGQWWRVNVEEEAVLPTDHIKRL